MGTIGFDGKYLKKLQADFDLQSQNRNQKIKANRTDSAPAYAAIAA